MWTGEWNIWVGNVTHISMFLEITMYKSYHTWFCRQHLDRYKNWDGEGNGNPLQCSCLENPSDWGAWWAAVYGVKDKIKLKKKKKRIGVILHFIIGLLQLHFKTYFSPEYLRTQEFASQLLDQDKYLFAKQKQFLNVCFDLEELIFPFYRRKDQVWRNAVYNITLKQFEVSISFH